MFTLKNKLGTPTNYIYIYIYIFVLLSSQKKFELKFEEKKIVTKQAHQKPNINPKRRANPI